MKTFFKALFLCFCGLCLVAIGGAIWGMREVDRYAAMTPEQRAASEAAHRAKQEADRRERIRGTDCENLDAAQCYTLRTERRRRDAFIRELQESGELERMQEAREDAGLR